MTLHPDTQRLLDIVRLSGRPPMQTVSVAEARTGFAAARAVLQRPAQEVASVRDVTADGVPARLYRAEGGVLPGVLYLHGGGWVVGGLDSHDGVCRRLANLASAAVLAVDYRMAPEHRFPAAVDDGVAALRWMVAQASALGIDPARLAVAGDSAGGNLAAVLALMGRDGTVPRVGGQVLFYPVTDLTMDAPSYRRPMAAGVPLTADTMRWFIEHYVPDPAQRADWRASPLLAASLAGAPPAFVLTVGQDPLADEGRAYAARLEADGVRVMALHLSDQIHGIVTMDRFIEAGEAVVDMAATFLRDVWRASA